MTYMESILSHPMVKPIVTHPVFVKFFGRDEPPVIQVWESHMSPKNPNNTEATSIPTPHSYPRPNQF